MTSLYNNIFKTILSTVTNSHLMENNDILQTIFKQYKGQRHQLCLRDYKSFTIRQFKQRLIPCSMVMLRQVIRPTLGAYARNLNIGSI